MKIRLLSSALDDLSEGRLFYEKQGEGLGEYFFDSLFSDIDSLTLYGGIHPKFFGYHRMLSKRFPYAIYYKLEEESVVVVWRVLDLRRDPKKIRQSLKPGRNQSLHLTPRDFAADGLLGGGASELKRQPSETGDIYGKRNRSGLLGL